MRTLHAPFLARLADLSTYTKLIFPVKASLMPDGELLVRMLQVTWLGSAIVLIRNKLPRAALFCLAWAALALMPVLPVWYIGAELENGRFVYLLSAPLCSALVLSLLNARSVFKYALVALIAIAFTASAAGNVRLWAAEDAKSKRFISELTKISRPSCIVNPPLIDNGVFQFFTARAVHLALRLLPAEVADRTIKNTSFLEPIFRPDELRLINITVLRNKLLEGKEQVLIWTGKSLVPIRQMPRPGPPSVSATVTAPSPCHGPAYLPETRLITFSPAISTLDYDYLDIDIKASKHGNTPYQCYLTVIGRGSKGALPPIHVPYNGEKSHRVHISDRLHWLEQERIHAVEIRLSDSQWRISSVAARARSKGEESPLVTTGGLDQEGVLKIAPDTTITADASRIKGAEKLIALVSNSHYRLMESKQSIFQAPVSTKLPGLSFMVDGSRASFTVPPYVIPDLKAQYELRIGAADQKGKPLGYWSDPISITAKDNLSKWEEGK